MPEKCPLPFGLERKCDECGKYWKDTDRCGWFFPSIPLSEILTDRERIERLESKNTTPNPIWLIGKQWDTINQIKAQTIFLNNKIKELQIKKKDDDVPF